MKDATPRPVSECLSALETYDAIIDARSPSEFALDRLPGAINLPVLDDAERAEVGLLNKERGAFEAKRRGAALVSQNIGEILKTHLADKPLAWKPLVYCWRGGNRSGSLATVLARIGWHVHVIDGGYRAYRRQVVADLAQLPQGLEFHVIAGRTGSGKSRLLRELGSLGAQILDLEQLAEHRGSVLGPIPDCPQPSQKQFESRIWQILRAFDPSRPIYVESESRKIGQCQVPEALILRLRASRCIVLEASSALRASLLIDDYAHFVADPDSLCARLQALCSLHGHQQVADWNALARAGNFRTLVGDLLEAHYDPAYDRSMKRNFARLSEARVIALEDSSPETAIADAASRVLAHDAV